MRSLRPDLRTPLPVTGVRLSLWRAVTAFRAAALVIDLVLIVRWRPLYDRPTLALATGAAMVAVTLGVAVLGANGHAHRPAVVVADVLATIGLTLVTIPVQTAAQQHGGMITLTSIWAAGPTLEAAFLAGPLGGTAAAVLQYLASVVVAGTFQGRTLYSGVLLLLAGAVVGLVARLAVRAEDELRAASAAQAAVAERERLTRQIHDGVLQVLGLVHRTGRDAPAPWPAIAGAAAEQEAALRGLITSQAPLGSAAAPSSGWPCARCARPRSRSRRPRTRCRWPPRSPARWPTPSAPRSATSSSTPATARAPGCSSRTDDAEIRVTVRDDGAGMPDGGWKRRTGRAASGWRARCAAGWPTSAVPAPSSPRPARAPRST